jgi:8-oxo-dGTP pyrophosphatase MutT (NUDIX family)
MFAFTSKLSQIFFRVKVGYKLILFLPTAFYAKVGSMPHIHTATGQHDHTVSAYIFRYDGEFDEDLMNLRLLVHMHKKFGILLQPGGHVELNENPWAALNHEILEETGYDMDQLFLLQPNMPMVTKLSNPSAILHPVPFFVNTHDASTPELGGAIHRHTDTNYIFLTNEEPRHKLGEDESQDLRWLSQSEIEELDSKEISSIVRDAAPVAFNLIENTTDWCLIQPSYFKTSL